MINISGEVFRTATSEKKEKHKVEGKITTIRYSKNCILSNTANISRNEINGRKT